jgi:hypothetical protein
METDNLSVVEVAMNKVVVGRKSVVYTVADCLVLAAYLKSNENSSDSDVQTVLESIRLQHHVTSADDSVTIYSNKNTNRVSAYKGGEIQLKKGFVMLIPHNKPVEDFMVACKTKHLIIIGRSTLATLFVPADEVDIKIHLSEGKEVDDTHRRSMDI